MKVLPDHTGMKISEKKKTIKNTERCEKLERTEQRQEVEIQFPEEGKEELENVEYNQE